MENQDSPSPIQEPAIISIPPTPATSSNKSLIILFSILILILIGLTGFLYYQNQQLKGMLASYQTPTASPTPSATTDPTANWKTYTSIKDGFSIKYPNNWKVNESPTGGIPLNMSSTKYPSTLPQGDGKIFFFSSENGQKLKLLDWVKKYGHNQGVLPATAYSQTTINNLPAVEINYTWTKEFNDWIALNKNGGGTEGPPPFGTKFRDVYFSNNDQVVEIQAMYSETKTDFFAEVDQILSTFKFLGAEVGVCKPNFPIETNMPELTASENYAIECTSKKIKNDCLLVDIYNAKSKDFSKPDGIPDCDWTDSAAKACAQEAKLCPDGSSVGKTGPNCEFTPCL